MMPQENENDHNLLLFLSFSFSLSSAVAPSLEQQQAKRIVFNFFFFFLSLSCRSTRKMEAIYTYVRRERLLLACMHAYHLVEKRAPADSEKNAPSIFAKELLSEIDMHAGISSRQ